MRTDNPTGIAGRILKVNHAGEFGAVNIYRAQIAVARLFRAEHRQTLEHFIEHEKEHLALFGRELERRGLRRCRSFWLCGMGGYALGLSTGLFGRGAVMACTAAVETVVTSHIESQLVVLRAENDMAACHAVESILQDEEAHRDAAVEEGATGIFYGALYRIVAASTELVIWLGMKL